MKTHRPSGRRRSGAALLAAVLLLSGCGGAGDGTEAEAGVALLRYAAVGTPATATNDPHGGVGNESDSLRFGLVYDVLAVPGEDGETELRLASSIEPVDEELVEWTVRLRPDAVFSDGSPVRAADVLFSLRRIEDKAAENFGRLGMFDFSASEVVDEHTLTVVARKPYAEVPRALESVTFVVPEGSDDFTEPVIGSGPFTLVEGGAESAVLERNDDWWGPAPELERVEISAVADPRARAQAVIAGQADVAGSVDPATVREVEGDDWQVVRRPSVTMYPFVMRLDTEPFDDPDVREAFRLAVDRDKLVETVFLGYGQVGNDLIAPADPSSPETAQRERDLERARELLEEAGHGDGLEVVLHTTTSYPGMDTAATLYAEQLAEAGVTVEVRTDPPDTYWTDVFAQESFYTGFYGGIPFTDVATVALLSDAPTNETAWRRPEWDEGFDEALATADQEKRTALLGGLQEELRDEGGYVVWGTGDGLDLAAPNVAGLPDGPGFDKMFIDQVRLAD
ncbi:ABC transporter substrate-binding protein [Actinorugispora endophytica]|uniref:Peptide/nickel transport system substrate-binding protein n=1 Tax=Actinorugispora endophytica TaxID=1605990 RepID=A0A4R6V2E4_9ACTN|nr:ABC transporter substrate-binding protein [Actinorugispora endophytica]TDQ50264.1 peptide/nickel transport system substrate-binding protein [Actinorugispora endophytica]